MLERRQSYRGEEDEIGDLFFRCASTTVDATKKWLQRKRWSPSVHGEKSEFDRVAPKGDPTKAKADSAGPHGVRLRVPRRKSQAVDK